MPQLDLSHRSSFNAHRQAPCKCGGAGDPHAQHSCGCDKFAGKVMRANLLKGSRRELFDGEETLVVPVIMMRSDIVMNENLVPLEEIFPTAWDGVPVTLGHPTVAGENVSANLPEVLEQWAIGTILNSQLVDGALKAEAWINIQKANQLSPGLVAALESGDAIDVSTGYFSKDIEKPGKLNGRTYKRLNRNLNPDHLALLPGATGACSWEDGCGVRANRKETTMADETKDDEKVSVGTVTRILQSMGFGSAPKANRRGADDDYRQVVADLISNDTTPFVPQDEDSLRMMSYETLMAMRNQFLAGADADEVKDNKAEGGQHVADKDKANDATPLTKAEVAELVTNAVAAALKDHKPELSAEDKAALVKANELVANERKTQIDKIVANSTMKAEDLEKESDATLALIANGLRQVVDYTGRGGGVPIVNAADKDSPAVKSMLPPQSYVKPQRKEVN